MDSSYKNSITKMFLLLIYGIFPIFFRSSSDVDETSFHLEKISFLDYAKHRHGGIFHNSLVDDVKKLKMILAVFGVLIPYWVVYFQVSKMDQFAMLKS